MWTLTARDRHAEYLWACASLGTTIGAIATELRHLQRSEVGEELHFLFPEAAQPVCAMPGVTVPAGTPPCPAVATAPTEQDKSILDRIGNWF